MSFRRLLVIATSTILLAAGARADAGATLELPNLVPAKPFDIRIGNADARTGQKAVRFSVSSQNLGNYHFELLGAPPRDAQRTAAQQCVQWEGRVCLDRVDTGDFIFHATHGHWHLDNYASYELRSLLPDGTPDMSDDGLVVDGGKVSFCLIDIDRTSTASRSDPFYYTGYYLLCTGLYQGISQGWADIYDYGLPGQQIVIDAVADGEYAIVVQIDPLDKLYETTREDNLSWRPIRLSDGGQKVEAL